MGSETLLSDVPNHAKANTLTSSSSKSNSTNSNTNNGHSIDNPHNIQVVTNHDHQPINPISPMSSSFIPNINSNTNASVGCSSSSTTNQSKENLNAYQFKEYGMARHSSRGGGLVGLDYDRDETSTQSSNFTHFSKESSNGNGSTGGTGMIRSKSRIIFSDSEKFQSHHDLKSYYEKEEEMERHRKIYDMNVSSNDAAAVESSALRMIEPTKFFGRDVRTWTNGAAEEPNFEKHLRHFIDIHIAKARRKREEKYLAVMKKIGMGDGRHDDTRNMGYYKHSISSNSYIPYPSLRHERRFLYDVETYPLHIHLAEILGVSDLSLIHNHTIQDKKMLMKPLLDARKREAFHKCYDNFVTSFCIPLLHSLAMSDNLFNESSSSRQQNNDHQRKISYRYQAFPCIRVNRPGEFSIGPHCDMAYGHSMGNINFHIPLTPTYGTNALYTESHPGREDWHPLKTKSIGLGYSFDGARNLHFTLENTTQHTRVSIDFRIAIHRGGETKRQNIPMSIGPNNVKMMMEYNELLRQAMQQQEDERCNDVHDVLCHKKMLQDNYSSFPGYYEEAYVELGSSSSPSSSSMKKNNGGGGHGPGPVVCKRNTTLMHPDRRVGFPF